MQETRITSWVSCIWVHSVATPASPPSVVSFPGLCCIAFQYANMGSCRGLDSKVVIVCTSRTSNCDCASWTGRTDGDPLVFPSTKELGQGDLRRRTHSWRKLVSCLFFISLLHCMQYYPMWNVHVYILNFIENITALCLEIGHNFVYRRSKTLKVTITN